MPTIGVFPIRQEWHGDVAELITLGDVGAVSAVNGHGPSVRKGMCHVTQPVLT